MLLPRNTALIVLICLIISACGFTPVYQKGQAGDKLARISVTSANNRPAQQIRTFLQDKLSPSGQTPSGQTNVQYTLRASPTITLEPLSIESDGTTRRYRIIGRTAIVLTDTGTADVLFTNMVTGFSSYNISDDADYSTYVSSKDVTTQVLEAMAEDIRLRLIGYFNSDGFKKRQHMNVSPAS